MAHVIVTSVASPCSLQKCCVCGLITTACVPKCPAIDLTQLPRGRSCAAPRAQMGTYTARVLALQDTLRASVQPDHHLRNVWLQSGVSQRHLPAATPCPWLLPQAQSHLANPFCRLLPAPHQYPPWLRPIRPGWTHWQHQLAWNGHCGRVCNRDGGVTFRPPQQRWRMMHVRGASRARRGGC